MALSVPAPSKKIIILFVVLLALAAGVLWYLGGETTATLGVGNASSTASSLTPDQLSRIAASSTSLGEFNPAEPDPIYTQKNLKITTDNSSTSLKSYAQSFRAALRPYGEPRPYEAALVVEVIEEGNSQALADLKTALSMHQALETKLKGMAVPSDVAAAHLTLLNRTASMAFLMKTMIKADTEPVAALQSGREFIDVAPYFFTAINQVNDYFTKRNFQFTDTERLTIYVNVEE